MADQGIFTKRDVLEAAGLAKKERKMENGAVEQKPKEIFKAILSITQDLIKEGGIGKNRVNDQQKFKFRGIEDIQNALAPLLVKHQVCIVPTFANRKSEQYDSKSGGKLFNTIVEGVFDFISAIDGSNVRVTIPGEAMDTADKSTNKAMSVAMKYASILTFCIPTEGEEADSTTHEVREKTNLRGAKKIASNGQPSNGTASGNGSSEKSLSESILQRRPTKIVKIDGKTYRTAGIEGDQLAAIWKAAEGDGSATVLEMLKSYGLGKSVNLAIYLTQEEAQQLLAKV